MRPAAAYHSVILQTTFIDIINVQLMFEKKSEPSLSVAVTSATMYFRYFDVVS